MRLADLQLPVLIAILSLLVLGRGASCLLAASRPPTPNPFDTFVVIDRQLSILDQQLAQTKSTLGRAAGTQNADFTPGRQSWVQNARKMQPTITTILRASYRLEHRYGVRETRLHRPLFRRLCRKARVLRNDVRLLSQARSRRWARVVQTRISKALVAYAFDFQLVSGGYAALRCQTEQLACCDPVRKVPGGPFSCKWGCSQHAYSCRYGFPGPQTGYTYEQPSLDNRFANREPE
jgi:hypothetical protein